MPGKETAAGRTSGAEREVTAERTSGAEREAAAERTSGAEREAAVAPACTDCSSLVQWCCGQLGISFPRTAADQAKYCVECGLIVDIHHLRPGDLVFWSFKKNGRFQNISHTGIYAGDGKIIDASRSRRQVALRELFSPEKVALCARLPSLPP